MPSALETTASFHSSSLCLFQCKGRNPPLLIRMKLPWPAAGHTGIQAPKISAGQTTSFQSLSPGDALAETLFQKARIRTVALKGRKMTTAKSPNGVHDLSLSSSLHLNLVYSLSRLFTLASLPTRATYAPLYASQTTPSPCLPTHLRQSSALFARARVCTSPPSFLLLPPQLLQPAARACRPLQHPSRPHAACYVPTAATSHHQFCLL